MIVSAIRQVLLATLWLFLAAPTFSQASDAAPEDERARDREALERYLREVPLFVVPANAPYQSELTEAVHVWLGAVARRDVAGILPFVLPEDQESVRADLTNPETVMYRVLLSDRSETYRLARSHTRDMMLLRTGTPLNPGPGIKVCLFDRRHHDPQTDEERILLFRQARAEIVCHFFFYGDDHWRFGYSSWAE